MLQLYKQILNYPNFGMKKTYGCCRNRDIPSLGPVTPFKPRCTGHLRHGRVNECPSRYPPFFEGAPSHWGPWGVKTGGRREGEGRYPPVAQPLVQRHSKQKGNQGRDGSKFIRVAAAGTINAEGLSVASGL